MNITSSMKFASEFEIGTLKIDNVTQCHKAIFDIHRESVRPYIPYFYGKQ